LKNNILRNILISVISALLILIFILAFFQFVEKEPRDISYIIDEIFGSGARGALIIAVTAGINMVCLTVVDISNLESEKSRIKYEAYMKKQEEERDKKKAKEEAKAKPRQIIDDRPKWEISRKDRTDDYLAQQIAAVYEQRKKKKES